MRWGLFQAAEYINLLVLSGLCVTLFFDGYHFPWVESLDKFGPIWFVLKLFFLVGRLHLAARVAAAPALRPADALRLEGAAAGRDRQRARHRLPRGARQMSFVVPNTLEGLRRDAEAGLQEADHAAVPGVQAAGLPALPRPAPPAPARERAREVRRLLALRRRVPGRLHPRRRRPRTRPRTASRRASATRASTRSTCRAASSAATASSRARSTRSRSATTSRSPSTTATT